MCVAGVLGGCGYLKHRQEPDGDIVPPYGITPVRLPLGAVGYLPPSPIHAGTVLTFTAEIPRGEIFQAAVAVGAPTTILLPVRLLDDGEAPDVTANDRVFTGQLHWKPEYDQGEIYLTLQASGVDNGYGAYVQEQLPNLTVLP